MTSKDNADYLMDRAMNAGITDPRELANFMGQMSVESGGFSRMAENLGYGAETLYRTFPGRNGLDSLDDAQKVVDGGQERIANTIYGAPWGIRQLGNTEPGDGFKYHGRGFVQLTGRHQYELAGAALGLDLVEHPELAEGKEVAAKVAIHYWQSRVVPDRHQLDVADACESINGGHKQLQERRDAAAAWQTAIEKGYRPGGHEALPGVHTHPRGGSEEGEVAKAQRLLNALGHTGRPHAALVVDGNAGKQTVQAIKHFQESYGLEADGIAGPQTMGRLEVENAKRVGLDVAETLLDHVNHPARHIYEAVLEHVKELDAQHGRPPGPHTMPLAGAITSAAVANGMTNVDHVALSEDASRVYAVQGDLASPFKKYAELDVMEAVRTPLSQSSAEALHHSTQHTGALAALQPHPPSLPAPQNDLPTQHAPTRA